MLKPGTLLGHYEILNLIGVGGMGEVYRAHDNKLRRDVALKVLPEAFARDPDRIARFRREAQLLAQLNHPNIAAIYNAEEAGGTHFLVMELVLGDTLRERIKRGPLPVEETLHIGKQIAAALEHAHEKTVMHRDLKPANVKVTPEGLVKVLDFGLAKAFAGDAPSGDPGDAPTLGASPTLPGVILGTASYMSPEQARGRTVDRRTDIWALGCVLYELLTGQQAFQSRDREGAGTVQDILARVLEGEPDWSALPETTPATVRALLRRCLQKEVQQRPKDAGDLRIELETLAASSTALGATAEALPARRSRRQILVWGAASLVLATLTGLAVWNLRPAPAPQPVSRVVVPLLASEQLGGTAYPMVALSPDGAQLAYVASRGGGQQIYLRAMDSLEAKALAGTENAINPFFSPDGQWIGFFADGKLKKVAVSGGAALTLSDASTPRGASWGPNDTIVFAPTSSGGLSQVSAAGGTPQALTKLKQGETNHRWPQFLPDGKTVLFTAVTGGSSDDSQIAVQRLDTAEQRVLFRGGTSARYVPTGPSAGLRTGHLVYYRSGTIMAVPFDPKRLEVRGTPAPALEGVLSSSGNTGAGQFTFSGQGSLAYVQGGAASADVTPVWVERKGAVEPLGAPPRNYLHPQLSPDGRQLALNTAAGTNDDIWVYDLSRRTLTRLTFEGINHAAFWTPDGKRIVFRSIRGGEGGIYWKPADGAGAEEQITKGIPVSGLSSVSSDGKLAFYSETHPKTGRDIGVIPLEGDRKASILLQTPFEEGVPKISPDGRWLAYLSNDSGRYEVYVRPFPGPGGKWQISTEGGTEPLWARNGRELFYRNREKVMAVDIAAGPSFQAGTPRLLFEGNYVRHDTPFPETTFDISPDGQRFLMLKATEQQQTALTQIHVVLNWFEELKRRVPVR